MNRYVLIDEQCNARKVVFESAKSWLFVAQSATIDLYKSMKLDEVQSDFDGDVPLRFKDCQKIQAARQMRRKVSNLAVPAVCRVVFRS